MSPRLAERGWFGDFCTARGGGGPRRAALAGGWGLGAGDHNLIATRITAPSDTATAAAVSHITSGEDNSS